LIVLFKGLLFGKKPPELPNAFACPVPAPNLDG
jgi:hypothetical protein